jgi:hypothetical protein
MRTLRPDQIADLQALDAAELRSRWQEVFGSPAWKGVSRDLLLRALAYRTQEIAEGGMSKSALRSLARLAGANGSVIPPPRSSTPRLKPGTRLVREWRGETHQVTVTDTGFEYRGSRYASLSEIARLITGTRWSGPLFFGLRKPSRIRSADET